ncbi:tetratricopeptide repeat protein [bacterium]|nr:tetratricopeptide repeat protein [bacterium]
MVVKCPKCNTENPDTQKFCGECATPLPSSKEIPVTETLETPKEELTTGSIFAGRYQIIEVLGKGGMGKVYKAIDKKLNEEVALKIIKPEIASDKKTLERFNNELKLARKIAHKNVGRMYELMEEKGTHFITMEYVPGQDLRGLIRQSGQLAVGTAISIAKQVCEGMAEAHRLGVIHRDLNPQNIMIDKEGNARIMDFGIARTLKAKGITGAGVMVGTPEYMSPEQVESKEVDQRSDIYSLGVILYEMVTGRVPFEGETPLSVAVKHKTEAPPDPRRINTQIPENLSRLILNCLEKDKEKRTQSADDVHSELDKIEKGIPTAERIVPKRKPITSREITVQFSLKKLLIPALVVIALGIAVVIIMQLLPRKQAIPPIPSDNPSLAVMYFKNNTGDKNLDHLRTMLSDLLITDLFQSRYLAVLSREKLFEILSQLNQLEEETYSADILKDVAVQGGVSHLLLGSYARMGDVFRIDVVIQEAGTGKIIGSERVEARGEEDVFLKVDELTRKIKANFNLSKEDITSDLDKDVEEITTSSPEAYRFYSEGLKYLGTGDVRGCIALMEKAVEIDPEFAAAYRYISASYGAIYLFSESKKYIQKAVEFKDRASDRDRLLIEGSYFRESEKTFDKAIEAYTQLLALYPEALDGAIGLGTLYRNIEEWDKAIERYKTAIPNKFNTIAPYTGAARAYMGKGLYKEAKEILEEYITDVSDNSVIRYYLARNYIHQGKLDLALTEIDKAFVLDPTRYGNFLSRGDIYVYTGDFVNAEEEYQKLKDHREPFGQIWGKLRLRSLNMLLGRFEKAENMTKQGIEFAQKMGEYDWKSVFHDCLARSYLRAGKLEQALKECDLALDSARNWENLERQRTALCTKGLVYVEMKSLEDAQRTADELKQVIEEGMNKKAIRLHYLLEGKIELEKGNNSEAIEHLKNAVSLLSHGAFNKQVDFIDLLAFAYYETGDLENALKQYECITSLTQGRIRFADHYALSFYMLGKIHEELGNTAEALENYEKFLTLWKDADPSIAEVEDARKRLAGLKR